jgi:choline kinase
MGRPMLDWILEALEQGGVQRRDVVFICGYKEHEIRQRYPDLTYVLNAEWEHNNILLSLLKAREYLKDGFVSTYADIVYEGALVEKLVKNSSDIVLGCDTRWRRRYVDRSQHPETDAEKLTAAEGKVTAISRRIPSDEAYGEFVGVMKVSREGASDLLLRFDEAEREHAHGIFREGRPFQRAYLIDLLAHMLERGSILHHEDTAGGYMELDTLEDLRAAERWWQTRP